MPARLPSNYVRWVDTVGCHACQGIFDLAGLNDGDFFACPKCGGVERFVAGYMWPKGSSLAIAWFDEKGNPLPPNPEEEKIRERMNAMIASMMAPDAALEPRDPFSPPPVLAPLGHETNPEPKGILGGLKIAGAVAALFVLALAILAVNGAFERPPAPSVSPPPPTPEMLAARAAQVAEREADDQDAASVLRHWPDELDQFTPFGQQVIARMQVPEGGKIGLGDGFYRFERSPEGDLRLVRIVEEIAPASSEEEVASDGQAVAPAVGDETP